MNHRCARLVLLLGLVASGAWPAHAQPAPASKDPEYLFLDTVSTGAMTKNLEAAGQQGFVIHSASSLSMLLKRGEPTPRVYRLVATTRESTLAKELNELGTQGFRVVPSSVMEFAGEWVMALEQQPQGTRFMYDVVKGDDQVEGKLNALRRQGGVLVGVVGKPPGEWQLSNPPPVLIVERAEGGAPEAAVADHQFRIASTQKSSTLLKEVTALAAKGFRPIGAGFMTIVMERAPQATPDTFEYQMVAAGRRVTIERELNDFASTGFRVIPKAMFVRQPSEMVFFLRRTSGATDSFHYILLGVTAKTIDADIRRHAAEGYMPVGLLGGRVVILERTGKPKT